MQSPSVHVPTSNEENVIDLSCKGKRQQSNEVTANIGAQIEQREQLIASCVDVETQQTPSDAKDNTK